MSSTSPSKARCRRPGISVHRAVEKSRLCVGMTRFAAQQLKMPEVLLLHIKKVNANKNGLCSMEGGKVFPRGHLGGDWKWLPVPEAFAGDAPTRDAWRGGHSREHLPLLHGRMPGAPFFPRGGSSESRQWGSGALRAEWGEVHASRTGGAAGTTSLPCTGLLPVLLAGAAALTRLCPLFVLDPSPL